MKKIFFFYIVLAILVIGCVTTETAVQKTAVPTPVAVWDFEDLTPYTGHQFSYLKTVLADVAIKRLNEIAGVQPIERSRIVQVLEEQAIGSSELASEKTKLRLGKLLGAREMIFGAFQILGGQARIDVRLVDVETSRVISADEKTLDSFDADKAMRAVDELVSSLFSK